MSGSRARAGAAVGFYGDDFTGSVDALLQFARNGWTGALFAGPPPESALAAAARRVDVVGIAGIARSLDPAHLSAEVTPALELLREVVGAAGPGIVQYKACSTADSSPAVGSLGRVLEIGREVTGAASPTPALFAQPDFGRYTVFGHHFAADAGGVYRLDRQPTMSAHPVTPMTESDLAIHLGAQTEAPIGSVPWTGFDDLDRRLGGGSEAALVLDALGPRELTLIGEAIWRVARARATPVFAIGSGGLSTALAATRPGTGAPLPTSGANTGPVLAVSGSRSPRTQEQFAAAARAGWFVADLLQTPPETVLATLRDGRSVALSGHTSAAGPDPLTTLTGAGAAVITAAAAVADRFIVCGGDSSSRIITGLGIESLSIAAHLHSNIALLSADDPAGRFAGAEFLLKGGQMGDIDLFEQVRTGIF